MDYKTIIKSKGLKSTYLAEKIGVSKQMFSMFLNHKRNLSPEKKRELDRLLDIK